LEIKIVENMNKNLYYQPLIKFFEDLKVKYENNQEIIITYNLNNLDDSDQIKFVSHNSQLFTFIITLWTEKNNFPRVCLHIQHPDEDKYFEIIDEYNGGKDIDIAKLIEYIKTILSNKFVFKNYYLNGKKIRSQYLYYAYINNKVKFINSDNKLKWFILPWEKTKILERKFEFDPWI